ncbi:hypothetical protein [Sporolactobacillus nakayamae]|uniref:Predicted small secreted protein n=1 Tax=Sporolactobacillus nakayamae TaxID=269670 RepID=A0A1I2RQY9_9BACL|nr:hypothetical protein [Sporolactobacillus nakayamae]SFG42513.1 Predicted small secreted protein [Sporolactobacillus nakayamae]
MKSHFGTALVIGLAAGYLAGTATSRLMSEKKTLSSEKVLERVKDTVTKQLTIDGAWIYLSPHIWSKDSLTHMVYRGGLISNEKGGNHHFDFIADAASGTILEFKAQKQG